jgi:hypothetical protein
MFLGTYQGSFNHIELWNEFNVFIDKYGIKIKDCEKMRSVVYWFNSGKRVRRLLLSYSDLCNCDLIRNELISCNYFDEHQTLPETSVFYCLYQLDKNPKFIDIFKMYKYAYKLRKEICFSTSTMWFDICNSGFSRFTKLECFSNPDFIKFKSIYEKYKSNSTFDDTFFPNDYLKSICIMKNFIQEYIKYESEKELKLNNNFV